MTRPRPSTHTYWVNDNLLAGHYPGDQNPDVAARKIREYLASGVDCFVDLTRPGEMAPYESILRAEAAAIGRNVEYHRHTIPDMGVPERYAMLRLLDMLDDAVAAGHTVYVHCWGGVGRTGTVVGCYLVRHGMTGSEALTFLRDTWTTVTQSGWHPRTPETGEQQRYVRAWRED